MNRSSGLLVALAIASSATAQDFATPPAPTASRPFQIAAPREAKLANGLRIVVAERHGLPLVTARLLVLSGNEVDPLGKAGLATLTADLLTQGTKRRSASELATAAEALGGHLDSDATWDRSTVAMTITTPKLDEALALIAETVIEPAFADDELQRIRKRSIDALKVAYANPGTVASLVATRMVFGSGAYGSPVGGTPASLARIDRDDVVALYDARYRPDNAVLVLVGDIDLAHAKVMAQRRFGRWQASRRIASTTVRTTGTPTDKPLTIVDMGSTGQAGVVVALPLANGDAGDTQAWTIGQVTDAVLGGGFSSRLNQEIRIKRGLSYGALAVIDRRRDGSLVRASAQTKSQSATEVVGLVQHEIDRLIDEPVPDDELNARKATLIGTFSRSVETTSGLGQQITALIALGRSPQELTTLIERLSAVRGDQVQDFARHYFAASVRRVAVAGDASQFDTSLKAAMPDFVSIKQADLDLDQ